MLSANQIAGFLNQLFLQNKSMEWLHFLDVDANLQNEELIKIFLVGHGQKWVWPIWSWDSKIDSISRMNRWN